jgi:hypothetical protein
VSSGDAALAGPVDSMQVEDTTTAACISARVQQLSEVAAYLHRVPAQGLEIDLNAGMSEVLKPRRVTGALPKMMDGTEDPSSMIGE